MRLALAAALLLSFAPAASAAGQDSLLSGYGGPGDGEQALLGQTLIRDSGASGPATSPASSTSPPAATPAPGPQEIFKPASAAPVQHARPAKPKPKPGSSHQSATVTPKPARPASTKPPVTVPAARASSEVPAAVGGRDIALAVAVIVVLGVLAGLARRLAVRAGRARRPLPLYEP
jgi:hypothetical protein